MKAVWLSSTYYLDPAIANLPHPDAERLFTRAIAYCGNAETRGFVPKSVLKTFGIRAVYRRVTELIDAGIWVESDADSDGNAMAGYHFKSWEKWNKSGDDLLKRQKSDRERQRRARERRAQQPETESRDNSRDVTPPEQSRGENNATRVPSGGPVSNAYEPRETAPPRIDEPGPKVAVDGWRLVKDVAAGLPQATKTALAHEASAMLRQGIATDVVAAGLELWMTKALGPGQLPNLVTDVIKARTVTARPALTAAPARRETAGERKSRELAEASEQAKALLRQQHTATQAPLMSIVTTDPPPDWNVA